MTDVAEIAAGLSRAQREFLHEIPCYAVKTYPPAKWLVHKNLAEWSNTGWCIPLSLGLAVRAHLKDKGTNHG